MINLDEHESVGTHCIDLYANVNNRRASCNAIYLVSFGVEHIPKKIIKFIGTKNITNIYVTQAYNSVMCGYFCIGFNDFMLKSKSLCGYTRSFFKKIYEKRNKIFLKYFQ